MSKLLYCIQVYGNVWYTDVHDGINERNHSFTKANLNTLQTLQNKVIRLLTGQGYDTHIVDLGRESGILSVNQLVAYMTILSVYKIKKSGEPTYLANQLGFSRNQNNRRRSQNINVNFKLARGREGFIYRGKILFNALPLSVKMEGKVGRFKKLAKQWVRNNIPVVPP